MIEKFSKSIIPPCFKTIRQYTLWNKSKTFTRTKNGSAEAGSNATSL